MAQTLTCLYVHVVFSTKNRAALILPEIENDLYAYLGAVLGNHKSKLLAANGAPDHVHLLISLGKNVCLSELVGVVKRNSSLWIKGRGAPFRGFYWQDGYGAFSVGRSQLETVKDYIARQKIKHAKIDFKDEFRAILRKYEIEFDERYVWD